MEGLYQTPIKDRDDVLGSYCAELTEQRPHFEMTFRELSLLRAEILCGDTTYNDTLFGIERFTRSLREDGDLRSLYVLIHDHIRLHREGMAWEYIRKLKDHIDTEPIAEVLIAVFTSQLYEEVPDAEYSEDDIVYALKLFEKNDLTNRLFSFFDHCAYVIHWTNLIRYHLIALEHRFLAAQRPADLEVEVELAPSRALSSRYSGSQMFSPEFVMAAGADTPELKRRHDELLLSIADYVADPSTLIPIFNSTSLLIWREGLHMSFPNKLDWYLSRTPTDLWRCWSSQTTTIAC